MTGIRKIGLANSIPKKLAGIAVALALLIFAGQWGWHWWHEGRFVVATDDAYLQADIVPVSAEVTGIVTEVAVADNQAVRQGDVLVRIDDRDYRARVEQANADVANDEAILANLDARSLLQQTMVAGAQAQVAAAGAGADFAARERVRFNNLGRTGVSSLERSQQADADATRQNAELRGMAATATAAQQQLKVLATEKAQDEAVLQRHRAVLDLARIELDRTIVRAPHEGVVGARAARIGQFVQPGQLLLMVVPVDALYVTANFKETQLRRVALGMPAEIRVDTFGGEVFRGTVDSLAPASGSEFSILPPENATGNFTKIIQRFPIKILVAADNPLITRLRPGMSVTASIDTQPR